VTVSLPVRETYHVKLCTSKAKINLAKQEPFKDAE